MTNPAPSQYDVAYVDVSLSGLLFAIRQRWWWLAASVLLATSIAVAYAFIVTPIYQSSILLAPASGGVASGGSIARLAQSFGGGIGGLLGGGNADRNNRAIALSSLTSPFFTRAFIEENDLLPILFADKWDREKGEWNVDSVDDIPTLSDGYELFQEEVIKVKEQEFSNLVEVFVEWTDPVLAAEWANMLVKRVNSRLRQQSIEDADLTIDYLNEELANTTAVELQQSIYFLIENEIQKRTVAKVQKEYAYRVLSPAIPSDPDKFYKPNRPVVIAVGFGLGLFAGLVIVFVIASISKANSKS